jgi:hypothetical protein
MHPAQRYPLTLALVLLVMSRALLGARATPARAVASAARSAPRPFTVEVPEQCPVYAGYARVAVARDPAIYRYADQNSDGAVCARSSSTRFPSTVLVDDGHSGAPNGCPAPFVLVPLERVPHRELVDDLLLVDRDGNGLVCLYQTAGRSPIVVIDNIIANPNS